MRFLVDQGVSPRVAASLLEAGHDAVHVRDLAMSGAEDERIVEAALASDRIIITEDMDFGALLVPLDRGKPSVILFRNRSGKAAVRSRLILQNLASIEQELVDGAIVVIEDVDIRVRRLADESGEQP